MDKHLVSRTIAFCILGVVGFLIWRQYVMAESMYDMNLRLDKLIVEKRVSGMVELRGGAMHAPRPPTSTNKVTRQRDLRLDLNELSDACESLDEPAGPRRGMVCELVDDAAIQRSDGADESTDDAAVPLHGGRGGAPEDAAIPLGRDTCEPHEEGMASLCTGRRSESPEAATVPVGVGEGESYTPGAIQEMHIHVLNMDSDPRGAQPTMEIEELASDDDEGLPPSDDTVANASTVDEAPGTHDSLSLNTSNRRSRRTPNRLNKEMELAPG